MKTLRLVVLCAAVMCLATAASAQTRGMGRLQGVVLDESGNAVADVIVRTATSAGNLIETTTDASGKWTLGGVGKGEWLVTFLKPGFGPKRLRATVERELERTDPIKITMAKS